MKYTAKETPTTSAAAMIMTSCMATTTSTRSLAVSGNDWLVGGLGGDELWGEDGGDVLYGEQGEDSLYGGRERDYLDGGIDDDYLDGGDDDDTLKGWDGNDFLVGGEGNDHLNGGRGDDYIASDHGLITEVEVGTTSSRRGRRRYAPQRCGEFVGRRRPQRHARPRSGLGKAIRGLLDPYIRNPTCTLRLQQRVFEQAASADHAAATPTPRRSAAADHFVVPALTHLQL